VNGTVPSLGFLRFCEIGIPFAEPDASSIKDHGTAILKAAGCEVLQRQAAAKTGLAPKGSINGSFARPKKHSTVLGAVKDAFGAASAVASRSLTAPARGALQRSWSGRRNRSVEQRNEHWQPHPHV